MRLKIQNKRRSEQKETDLNNNRGTRARSWFHLKVSRFSSIQHTTPSGVTYSSIHDTELFSSIAGDGRNIVELTRYYVSVGWICICSLVAVRDFMLSRSCIFPFWYYFRDVLVQVQVWSVKINRGAIANFLSCFGETTWKWFPRLDTSSSSMKKYGNAFVSADSCLTVIYVIFWTAPLPYVKGTTFRK